MSNTKDNTFADGFLFDRNPNVTVWDLVYGSAGLSARFGTLIDLDDYPNMRGKVCLFSVWVKHSFSGDGNAQLYYNGSTDTPATDSFNEWQRYTSVFRFPMRTVPDYSVSKAGASGTIAFAAPTVSELGSNVAGLIDVKDEQYQFRGTAAPTIGTWKDGDWVINSAPAVGSPAAWTCTTAGTPGTWTAWANL